MLIQMNKNPRLILPKDFDERAAFEVALKGWFRALVETEPGVYYSIYFSDPVRLQQDMAELTKQGEPCLAEPNLVILPQVTLDAAQNACQFLVKKGFFTSLKREDPVDQSVWSFPGQ
jgi:hypothetical protein